MNPPSDDAIRERAWSMLNEAMFVVALQCRRVRGKEPEDDTFVFRWWADLQFLIVALRRLRAAAIVAKHVHSVTTSVEEAVRVFDSALPALKVMRDVGEHIDAYAVDHDGRHRKDIDRKMLAVGEWDGTTYTWLDEKLNIDEARVAAETLHRTMRSLLK